MRWCTEIGPIFNDDWRVQVRFHEERAIDQWHDRGHARELERDLSGTFQDRVIVSRDDAVLFVYSADRAQAEVALEMVESQAQANNWDLESDLTHWNEETAEWEQPPGKSLSETETQGTEAETSPEPTPAVAPPVEEPKEVEPAAPEFEVRVVLPSRHDAGHLADRLTAEGLPCVRRWRHVVVGAPDEEAAQELAERIRMEAPIGSQATIQKSG